MSKLLIALLAASISISAFAANDKECLVFSKYAAKVAEAREVGISEQEMLDIKIEGADAKWRSIKEAIIGYVFTMQLSQPDARQLVYLKCSADAYK